MATDLLRTGIANDSIRVPHQALLEFVAAATKPLTRGGSSIRSPDDARRQMEDMLTQYEVLYPDEEEVRIAIRERPRTDSRGSMRICGRTQNTTG